MGKTLKGGNLDQLTRSTADGLKLEPLYEAACPKVLARRCSHDAERPWDVRMRVAHRDSERANLQARTDLQGGAASVLLALAPDAIERALDGVLLGLAPVALDAGRAGVNAAEALASVARGLTAAPLAFHLDPLSVAAQIGRGLDSVEADVQRAAATAVTLARSFSSASLFLASGRVVHEAGGTDAQELGFALACAVAYLKALDAAGLPSSDALDRIVLGLAADAEPFPAIAKLRAARVVWARLAGACGGDRPVVIEARSSRRMLSALDPWTNLLRLTAAGFGAAVGGADAIVLGTFTDALGGPTDFARRQARNTQLVLMEEAHLGRVADPAAGSGLIEAYTDQLARAAWRVFQAIEAEGGVVAALALGRFAAEVAAAKRARAADVARRKLPLVGASEFVDLAGATVAFEPEDEVDARAPPEGVGMTAMRWSEPFERLRALGVAVEPGRAGLAPLGPAAEHAARMGFARTLLAAGGLEPLALASGETASLVVLCGSDARYAAEAEAAARTLKAAGAVQVWLAGRGGEHEPAFRAAGVDRFVYAGCDAVEALEAALAVTGGV